MSESSPLLFITGLSGAGMSSALKILEDLGYEVFDNFPVSLIDRLLEDGRPRPIAVGIDTRTRGFDPQAIIARAQKLKAKLLLITADETVLQKRFSETRRKHPMAGDRPASAGIKKELGLLYDFRQIADAIVDTTELTIHDLRRVLTGLFGENNGGKLNVTVLSFGFKNGLPREADIVMDCRFLTNPHWDEKLKPMTGKDEAVAGYIAKDPAFKPFLQNLQNLLAPLFESYAKEGKSYLTIALGCTGGKHRSVFVAERLGQWIVKEGLLTTVEHRDIHRL